MPDREAPINRRPDMQQILHEDHNMPAPEHDGTELPIDVLRTAMNTDKTRFNRQLQSAAMTDTSTLARGFGR